MSSLAVWWHCGAVDGQPPGGDSSTFAITTNFRRGSDGTEYVILLHGARKGLGRHGWRTA